MLGATFSLMRHDLSVHKPKRHAPNRFLEPLFSMIESTGCRNSTQKVYVDVMVNRITEFDLMAMDKPILNKLQSVL